MKNAKQQSGETGEVASQSAKRQAYSPATAMWDPPPRDRLSYLTCAHNHRDLTHSLPKLCIAVRFPPARVYACHRLLFLQVFVLLLSVLCFLGVVYQHTNCTMGMLIHINTTSIWASWVGVQIIPGVWESDQAKNLDPEKNNSTLMLTWKPPTI